MKKEKYYVFRGDSDDMEFVIEVETVSKYDITFSLFHSDNSAWTELVRGKKILSLHDDGNGITEKLEQCGIEHKYEHNKGEYSYSLFSSKVILYNFVGRDVTGCKFKYVKAEDALS